MIKVYCLLFILVLLTNCGPNGVTPLQGPQGPAGTNGSSCTVTNVPVSAPTPNGGTLLSCPDGTSSLILNGSNGTAGTLITPIQFCPGTTTYPTTFSEVGFCIDNTLWAVYSLNGGFMTEIVPGTYSSNGVNSSCTFIVSPNCTVSN